MAIKDLRPKQGKADVTATVISKEEPRTWEKFGKQGKVTNAVIKDETGQIKLTLWNDEGDAVGVGDVIKITNGYVNEWQGEMQLTAGKFGKIEVLEKGTGAVPEGDARADNKGKAEPEDDEPDVDDAEDTDEEDISVDEEDVI